MHLAERENTTLTAKHHVLVHHIPFKSQPQGQQMGKITNDLKRSFSKPFTIQEILELFSNGHSIMLSHAQVDKENRFRFISASCFAIDIDDTEMKIHPKEILIKLKSRIAGMFYTFSHGKEGKGYRYRLVFQLDQIVNDELKMKGIIETVNDDLKKLGIPVDTQAKNPLQVVRGGTKFVLVNENNKLNTNNLLKRVQEENIKRQQELYDSFEKELRPVSFKVLKEMAEKVGYIPSGMGQGEDWKRIVVGIRHYANLGYITDDEGFELFDIISGGEQSQKSWETLRAHGQATIRSLVYFAKKQGYTGKFQYYEPSGHTPTTYNHEA
ncbi:hypothetical protein, partial [Cytobacillus sp. IB215665]|uniref:hypothetical protein n=1 Tax=Cytobacillus sp. IB215665 TaxID=3097357 RepID=UPI002A17DA54